MMGPDIHYIQQGLSTPLGLVIYNTLFAAFVVLFIFTAGISVYLYQRRSVHGGLFRYTVLLAIGDAATCLFFTGDLYQANGFQWLERGWFAGVVTLMGLALCGYLLRHQIIKVVSRINLNLDDE